MPPPAKILCGAGAGGGGVRGRGMPAVGPSRARITTGLLARCSSAGVGRWGGGGAGMHWKGGRYPPAPTPGHPAYAHPLSS